MDLFQILWDAFSPYMMGILKIAFAITLFKFALRLLRSRLGTMSNVGNTNPYHGIFVAFSGYLLGKGIPIIIGITDQICEQILSKLW